MSNVGDVFFILSLIHDDYFNNHKSIQFANKFLKGPIHSEHLSSCIFNSYWLKCVVNSCTEIIVRLVKRELIHKMF